MFTIPENARILFFKAQQHALFAAPVTVQGHTRANGTFVAPYVSRRKKRVAAPSTKDLFGAAQTRTVAPTAPPSEPPLPPTATPVEPPKASQSLLAPPAQPGGSGGGGGNGNGGEPPDKKREAQRQYAEVVARYTNPEGTKKDGWLQAPNGQPTKLNERQWVQVRTENFKQWFGDWEIAASTPVREAATFDEARKAAKAFQGQPLINSATGFVATVSRNGLDKMLSSKAVSKSETPATHALAVANLDRLFERAVLGWSKPDSEGDTNIKAIHRFFAPMLVDGRALLTKMTVKETGLVGDPNPLYTVEAISFEEIKNPAAQWVAEIAGADGIDPRTIRSAGLVSNLAERVQKFNPADVSRVVDANGEPLVVYHGTDQHFNKINFKKGAQNLFWFTSNRAAIEGGKVGAKGSGITMELFANVRNPANWKQYNNLTLGEFKGRGLDGAILSKNDEAKTFDGFVISQPTQIKSALGNTRAFDAKDAHINKAWPFPPDARFLFFKAA